MRSHFREKPFPAVDSAGTENTHSNWQKTCYVPNFIRISRVLQKIMAYFLLGHGTKILTKKRLL